MEKIIVTVDPDLEEIIPEFMELTRRDVATLRKLLEGRDLAGVKRVGHSLKGSGAGYGFDRISEIGAQIEKKAEAGGEQIVRLVDELEDYLARVEIVYQ